MPDILTNGSSFVCPLHAGGPFSGVATWRADRTCSYCGSLSEEAFFEAVEAGAKVDPTDKSYKAYLSSYPDKLFKQTYRSCAGGPSCTGPNECTHWVTRDVDHAKFYFNHLSPSGKQRFVDLVNMKKMKIGYNGYFYVLPYFMGITTVQ